jgi:hypothetical protein
MYQPGKRTNNKVTGISKYLSIITLNVSALSLQLKDAY